MLTVKAVGHQWYWSYEYSDFSDVEFDSYIVSSGDLEVGDYRLLEVDHRMVVPTWCDIRVLVSSADVLHSWAVPSLGVKVDAVPGRLNQLSFCVNRAGVYYGQCSEICAHRKPSSFFSCPGVLLRWRFMTDIAVSSHLARPLHGVEISPAARAESRNCAQRFCSLFRVTPAVCDEVATPSFPKSLEGPNLDTALVDSIHDSGEAPFIEGELVQVWSQSQGQWLDDGVISVAVYEDSVVDGLQVRKGSVKVKFADGRLQRWCTREQALTILKRSP